MTEVQRSSLDDGDFVEFCSAGTAVKGEYHCADCGHALTSCGELPRCPTCGGAVWEPSVWHPFSRQGET